MKSADRQKAFRQRIKDRGGYQVLVTLPALVADLLTAESERLGVTRSRAALLVLAAELSRRNRFKGRKDQSGPEYP